MRPFARIAAYAERNRDALPDWVREPETIWLVFALGFVLGAIIL